VWGRVSEQVRKLALIYAVSANHQNPKIGLDAMRWASQFVMHQTRRMLYMASSHVADNPFHAECLKLIKKLREAADHELPHQLLLKRMKVDAKRFRELIETLIQRGDVEAVAAPTAGRTGVKYRLLEG
jgi:tRNA U38,U39,U40 pseudouridine synthase TruA